jgi:hypothetical protein
MAMEGRPQPFQQQALEQAISRAGLTSHDGLPPEEWNPHQTRARAIQMMKEARQRAEEEASRRRERQAEHLRSLMEDCTGRAFRWIRGEPAPPIRAVQRSDSTWTTSPKEVVGVALQAWAQFWKPGSQSPDTDAYQRRWWPRPRPAWELPPITGKELQEALRATKARTAPGLDGWMAKDLKVLPLDAWEALAQMLDCVEKGARWPEGLHQAMVALLPKSPGAGPSAQRPIVLLPIISV